METRANYVVVGIFTLVAVLAAFGFVYWTAGIGERGEVVQLRFRIPGSASGLGRGSAVLFNGVKVGDVQRVYIDVSNPSVAVADAVVDRLTPITKTTTADVGLAGLTGQANIELRGGDPSEPNLLDLAEQQGVMAEMVAEPSAVTNLLQSSQSILRRAESVLVQLEGFANDAREPLTQTVRNVEVFSEALGRNAEGIDDFLASVSSMSQTLSGVSERLDSTLAAAEDLLRSVDREKVANVVDNVETFTARLEEASGSFDQVMTGVNSAVTSIAAFSSAANQTLARIDEVVAEVEPGAVGVAVDNFEQASISINAAAGDMARLADQINGRSEDIDLIISDAREMADKLNAASSRVDGVLAKVDSLLGSGEAEGLMTDASETLRSFRQVAETLNSRMDGILDGLSRFSGDGLRDVDALVGDARRAVNRIEQAVSDLERNPQRILSGGSGTVREYDGRSRR